MERSESEDVSQEAVGQGAIAYPCGLWFWGVIESHSTPRIHSSASLPQDEHFRACPLGDTTDPFCLDSCPHMLLERSPRKSQDLCVLKSTSGLWFLQQTLFFLIQGVRPFFFPLLTLEDLNCFLLVNY